MKYFLNLNIFSFSLVLCSLVSAEHVLLKRDSTGQLEPKQLAPVGRMLAETTMDKRKGSGFVAGKNYSIFTAAHIALKDTMYFLPYKSERLHKVVLSYKLNSLDLAIYTRVSGISETAYELGYFDRIRPGDQISYLGWSDDNSLTLGSSVIMGKGEMLRKNEVVDYIEFVANGVPGFSGGPIFDASGRVIAMISQGWDYKPIKGKKAIRVLRAFSIDILRQVENDLTTSVDSTSSSDNELGLMKLYRE